MASFQDALKATMAELRGELQEARAEAQAELRELRESIGALRPELLAAQARIGAIETAMMDRDRDSEEGKSHSEALSAVEPGDSAEGGPKALVDAELVAEIEMLKAKFENLERELQQIDATRVTGCVEYSGV